MPRSRRTSACSHSAMPSAVCTPRPWVKSCSANSPSASSFAMSSVTASPAVTAAARSLPMGRVPRAPRRDRLQRDDVELAGLLRAEEVGQADAVVLGLAREDEPLEHRLAVVGVEHDDLVALAVAREVA